MGLGFFYDSALASSTLIVPEAVFLVMLGTSSFPARHEVYAGNEVVPSTNRNAASGYVTQQKTCIVTFKLYYNYLSN